MSVLTDQEIVEILCDTAITGNFAENIARRIELAVIEKIRQAADKMRLDVDAENRQAMRDRILISLCEIVILQDHGKDIGRSGDYNLIRNVADHGEIPVSFTEGQHED